MGECQKWRMCLLWITLLLSFTSTTEESPANKRDKIGSDKAIFSLLNTGECNALSNIVDSSSVVLLVALFKVKLTSSVGIIAMNLFASIPNRDRLSERSASTRIAL